MKMHFARLLSVISFVTPVFSATHTVKEGDNMYRIALNHGVSLQALQAANPSARVGGLKIGQTLHIPSGGKKTVATTASSSLPNPTIASPSAPSVPRANGSYIIAEGDTFSSIAKARGISVSDLQQLNPDIKPTTMRIGQEIRVARGKTIAASSQVANQNSTSQTTTGYAKPVAAQKSPPIPSASPSRTETSKPLITSTTTSLTPKVTEKPKATETPQVTQSPNIKETVVIASNPATPVEEKQVSLPAEISTAATSVPIPAESKMPRPVAKAQPKQLDYQLIRTSREMTLAEFAAEHSVSVAALNEVNGWNFPASTPLAVDSELLLPAQP